MVDPEANLYYRLEQAEKHIEALEKELKLLRKDAEEREKSRLKWGIGVIGSVALTLFGIIWQYRNTIFR